MLWTLFVILRVAWFLGLVSAYAFGGFIHVLLVLAVAIVLIRIIQGRRALCGWLLPGCAPAPVHIHHFT